jgi:hypothetical protein
VVGMVPVEQREQTVAGASGGQSLGNINMEF